VGLLGSWSCVDGDLGDHEYFKFVIVNRIILLVQPLFVNIFILIWLRQFHLANGMFFPCFHIYFKFVTVNSLSPLV